MFWNTCSPPIVISTGAKAQWRNLSQMIGFSYLIAAFGNI